MDLRQLDSVVEVRKLRPGLLAGAFVFGILGLAAALALPLKGAGGELGIVALAFFATAAGFWSAARPKFVAFRSMGDEIAISLRILGVGTIDSFAALAFRAKDRLLTDQNPVPRDPNEPNRTADRLAQLGLLRNEGLISEAEFDTKRAEILGAL